jgi:hypothetical protein
MQLWLKILIPILVVIIILISIYSSLIGSIDNYARENKDQKAIPPTLGMCPKGWNKYVFTNGTYCIDPEYYPVTDDKGNLLEMVNSKTCPGNKKVINSITYCVKKND